MIRRGLLTILLCQALLLATTASAAVIFTEPASGVTVGALQFFDEDAQDNNFDARARVPLPSQGTGINVSNALTYEFWIAPSATAADNNASTTAGANNNWINSNIVLDRDLYEALPAHGFGLSSGQLTFGISTSGGSRTIIGGPDLRDGNWHFIALVRDGDTMYVYSDGVQRATGTGIGTGSIAMPDAHTPASSCGPGLNVSCTNSDPYLVFGQEKHEIQGNGYIGLISDIRISNIARYTGSTHTVPTAPMEADGNTVALYRFAEQTGTTVADSSGNSQTMTIVPDTTGPQWSASSPY